MKHGIEAWREARAKAMRSLDVDRFRGLLLEDGVESARSASDEVLLAAIHKARHQSPSIEPRLRLDSARWLRERGYLGLRGSSVDRADPLPGGEH